MTCAGIGGLAICHGRAGIGRRRRRKRPRRLLPPARGRRQARARPSTGSPQRFSVDAQSAPGRRRAVVPLLLSLRPGARRPAHRPPLHRRPRLVPRGRRVLVREQDSLSHYWKGSWYAERDPHISTAMALLFLSKGRRPIVMAKVKYGDGNDWNQHRRDAANLTAYTEEAWDLGLTWQVMDPADRHGRRPAAGARAVHQRQPGAGAACRTPRSCATTSTAAASSSPRPAAATPAQFDAGFRQLMAAVFPEPEYQLQRLTPGHPDLADARHGAARVAVRRPAVGRRIRLPHVRRLLPTRTCRATGSSPSPANGAAIRRR